MLQSSKYKELLKVHGVTLILQRVDKQQLMINYKKETNEMVLNGASITIDVINSLVPSVHLLALYHENGLVCYSVKTRGLDVTVEVTAFIKKESFWTVLPYICTTFLYHTHLLETAHNPIAPAHSANVFTAQSRFICTNLLNIKTVFNVLL